VLANTTFIVNAKANTITPTNNIFFIFFTFLSSWFFDKQIVLNPSRILIKGRPSVCEGLKYYCLPFPISGNKKTNLRTPHKNGESRLAFFGNLFIFQKYILNITRM
jgi:hypothetical protein